MNQAIIEAILDQMYLKAPSYEQIGLEINLNPQAVGTRVKRMKEQGILDERGIPTNIKISWEDR